MAEGRNRAEWQRASTIAAAALNASPRKKPVKPADLDPYSPRPVIPATMTPLRILAAAMAAKAKEYA